MSSKSILITGATDGIGLATARKLKLLGHNVIVHGRNEAKLASIKKELNVEVYKADLSSLSETSQFASDILSKHKKIDVLINNAGVYKVKETKTKDGFDVRFMVNTIAPYLLTKKLLPILENARVINLSSAAQSTVNIEALLGKVELNDFEAYAQSKLAITMWSRYMAKEQRENSPVIISVNPGSLLSTKMVKEGFNTSGNDINIGVDILTSLSLDNVHANHSGEYFDNDGEGYSPPQADGLDNKKSLMIVNTIEGLL